MAIKSFKSTGRFFEKLGKAVPLLDKDGNEIKANFTPNAFWKEHERGIGKLSEFIDARKTNFRK